MTFERSTDWETIKQVATHPRVYPAISDDFSPMADKWEPVKHESVWYVLVKDEDLLGMFVLVPENTICWKLHTCLLPSAYGKAKEIGKSFFAWVFANTDCLRIVTDVPSFNRLALKAGLGAGMIQFGVNKDSYMKHGKLHHQIQLGLSKEAVCH